MATSAECLGNHRFASKRSRSLSDLMTGINNMMYYWSDKAKTAGDTLERRWRNREAENDPLVFRRSSTATTTTIKRTLLSIELKDE